MEDIVLIDHVLTNVEQPLSDGSFRKSVLIDNIE